MGNFTQIDWNKFAVQGMAATFVRTNRIPLDKTEIYYSLDDAIAYAENEKSMAYAGQIISVVDSATNKSTAYVIQMDRTLVAVGTGAGSGSLSASTFADASAIAASAMPGQVIYVMNNDPVDPETGKSAHLAGPYIVNGTNTLDILAASSAEGDKSLESRVSALETTVSTIKPDVLASATSMDNAILVSAVTMDENVLASAKTYADDVLADYATSADTVSAIKDAISAATADTASQIEALDLANTYAAKEYETKIDTLIGDDEGKSARDIAVEEVAKIVASADTSFDTLKEIADWIKNDTTGAAAMANDIAALKVSAQTLDEKIEDYAADTVAAIEAVNGSNVKVGTALTGDTSYESGETVSSVLQGILDSLNGVKGDSITEISGQTITVAKSGSVVSVEVKLEEATSATTAEGHIEIAKNADGALYGTMYWDGDDTEE